MIQRSSDRVRPKDALLAVEERGGRLHGALLAGHAAAVDVVRAGSIARGPDLAADLRALKDLLAGDDPCGPAVLVTEQVTAVCLTVPPTAGLPAERMTSLVRWELEPFLARGGEARPAADEGALACGWAERGAGAEAPLFACGIAGLARAELVAAFKAAGLRLEGLYPALGCAAALAAGDLAGDVVVLELAGDRIGCTRLADGRVARFSAVRCDPGDPFAVADACLGLAGDGARLVLAGPVPDAVLDGLGARPYERLGHLALDPLGEPVGASLLGAAHHALRQGGGQRVPAVAARDPRPPVWTRPEARKGALAAVAVLALVGAEVALGRALAGARAATAAVSARAEQARDEARLAAALRKRAGELTTTRDDLALRLRQAEEAAASAGRARALLEAVAAAAPDDLAVDALVDDAQGLRLSGFALTPVAAQRFVRDVARALEPLGRAPRGHVVHRRKGRLGLEGYWFEARFTAGSER
ncbi:MAG: hypothetical protein M9894_39985 [Planctomycetes bacterium]|nr:hypothetical protein [Planctomycetota bacterium]